MVPRADEKRALAYAAAASLFLHGLMLVALRAPAFDPPPAAGILTARFQPPALEQAVAVEAAAPTPRREKRRPSQPILVPARAETVAALSASHESAKATAPEPVAVGAESRMEASAPAATLDTASIARYRQQLIGAAVRYKRYPPEALGAGAEGAVSVQVNVSPAGSAEVAVKASSGHELLDAQALEMFRNAAPQVPLPAALFGQAFGVEVRAIYSLRD